MEYRFIRCAEKDGVARIVLCRPPLNILTIEMMEEVAAALAWAGTLRSPEGLAARGARARRSPPAWTWRITAARGSSPCSRASTASSA